MRNPARSHLANVRACHRWLENKIGEAVDIVVFTGSSGPVALVDFFEGEFIEKKLPKIFPQPSIVGHSPILRVGMIGKLRVAVFSGRAHRNEDAEDIYRTSIVTRAIALWGVKTLIMTNASGALDPRYKVGDVIVVDDHITLFAGMNSLVGDPKVIGVFGERFLDTTNVYDKRLRRIARRAGKKVKGIRVCKNGTYVMVPGPRFETPAEVRMLKKFAHAAGMSSVHEAEAAHQAKVRVLLLSMITNPTFGKRQKKGKLISHEENLRQVKKRDRPFAKLLVRTIKEIGKK